MARPVVPLHAWIACLIGALVAGLVALVWPFRNSASENNAANNPVVATVGHQSITLRELEQTVALPLHALELQRYGLLQQGIQQLIDEKLLQEEAARKGVTVPQLLEEASGSEAIAKLANLPAPVKRIRASDQTVALDGPEQARIRQALVVALRRQTDVRINLPRVDAPVLDVQADGGRRLGPDKAPVKIIEFSDFQCPFCQMSAGVLQELRRTNGDKVQLVYRDFPGQNHPAAWPAAEAAQCAGEQGKFWEYHDLLFNRQALNKPWDFLALATELGLQAEPFSGCLKSGRFRGLINKDIQDGLRLGVNSTPTFFINGRPLVGAQSISAFQALIDQALQDSVRS